jgi:UTP-glucose-1-phosphate uridylyltransferase
MKTTLLIMAAGIGSRFGTGIKQLEPVDASNHIIMDYSIHDAIEAGFNHVVFIIRKDIEKEFKEVIGDRIASICSSHNVTVDYAFQDINDIPGTLPEGRTKPWGTGQAVLAAKDVIKTPFIVINADDYYGKEGFKAVHEYLVNGGKSCMAGFVLKNTLSDNGGVTRGICKMDEQNNLTEVVETKNIVKTATGAEADSVVVDVNSLVSMNIHNVLSFRGWHSEWNGILQAQYSVLFSFLLAVLKIGFVHFIHDAVHILRGQLSAGKKLSKLECEMLGFYFALFSVGCCSAFNE